MSTRPAWWKVVTDALSWVGGWILIFQQAGVPPFSPPDQVNETIVWLAAAMVGVPGISQILVTRFGGSTPTGGSSPGQAPPASLPSSSGEPSREAEPA